MKKPTELDIVGLVPGRACRNCMQIKVKCIPQLHMSKSGCQRCHRLGKSCTTPAPVSRKQRARPTRVKQLEERVDQLATLVALGSSAHASGSSSDFSSTQAVDQEGARKSSRMIEQSPSSAPPPEILFNGHEAVDAAYPIKEILTLDDQVPAARLSSPCVDVTNIPGRKDGSELLNEYFCPVHIGFELEKSLFEDFRTNMTKHFPFVVVDGEIPADNFKMIKPFSYWACILAASHRDRRLHPVLHNEMMRAIGHRLFIAGDKSLDMLQGLLLMAAWTHNISHFNPQLMNLLHLAQALLADMGILKPVRVHDKIRITSDTAAFFHGKESTAVAIGMDEKRALLGFYCLSWKAAITFNRIDPMRHSQHIDSCCESLKYSPNCESDQLVIELVHLYSIVGRFFHVDRASTNSLPMYRTMFAEEIRQFRRNLPTELEGNYILELEILGNSLCIVEPSYTIDYQSKVEHLDVFHNCIEIGKQLVEALMSIPNDDYPSTTILVTMSLVQIMTVFSRLSFFKSNSWDTQYSCSNVKLDVILEQLAAKYTKINQLEIERYPQYQAWRYLTHAHNATHIKGWYKAKVAAEKVVFDSTVDETMPNDFSEYPFGSSEDPFWLDLMSNWNEF